MLKTLAVLFDNRQKLLHLTMYNNVEVLAIEYASNEP